jgi:hypothetical protein
VYGHARALARLRWLWHQRSARRTSRKRHSGTGAVPQDEQVDARTSTRTVIGHRLLTLLFLRPTSPSYNDANKPTRPRQRMIAHSCIARKRQAATRSHPVVDQGAVGVQGTSRSSRQRLASPGTPSALAARRAARRAEPLRPRRRRPSATRPQPQDSDSARADAVAASRRTPNPAPNVVNAMPAGVSSPGRQPRTSARGAGAWSASRLCRDRRPLIPRRRLMPHAGMNTTESAGSPS